MLGGGEGYTVHLVSFKNGNSYSCLQPNSHVFQWQLEKLKDFIAEKEAELAAPPEVVEDYSDLV